jgi:membrane-associated phospholipid phosphatase
VGIEEPFMACHHLNYGGYPMQILPVGLLGFGGILHRMFHFLRLSRFGAASAVILLGSAFSPALGHAQESSLLAASTQSADTTAIDEASTGAPRSSKHATPDPADLEVSWRKMPMRFLHGEKDIWLFPVKLAAGKNWLPAAIGVGSAARGEDSAEQGATGSSPQSVSHMQSYHEGLVRRSVKRTLEDQKELYLTPFKPANFKWDALELGGTAALLASDRHIENHIGTAHYTFYQATSDVAIAGLGATLAGVWIWGIKGDHPHAKETGVLELETLVDTFLIYTPMQVLAGRQRPGEGNGNGDFWKHHNINTSFPGGHAMFTFAMATVVSHEYPQKWVQTLAYLAATTVTVTRFMARDHWSSDMFVGAALGIGIGSHVFHAHCNPELSDSCKHHVRWIF